MAALSNTSFINASTTDIVSSITMSPPKVNGLGGKSININYQNTRMMLRMPKMMCWGIDDKEFDGKSKLSLTLQFPSAEKYNTPELTAVLENLKKFEQHVKEQAIVNCKEWFNKSKMSMDVVDALFTPILRYPRTEGGEPNYAKSPSLNVKIPAWDGRIDSEVFDAAGQILFPNSTGLTLSDLIPKQTVLSTLITCGGIWFAGGKFGVTFKLRQAALEQKTQLTRGVCHILSKDEEKSGMDKLAESMGGLKVSKPPPSLESIDKLAESLGGLKVERSDEVGVEVADSDDERADPDTEYSAAAAEPDAPVKGRKKVVKK